MQILFFKKCTVLCTCISTLCSLNYPHTMAAQGGSGKMKCDPLS